MRNGGTLDIREAANRRILDEEEDARETWQAEELYQPLRLSQVCAAYALFVQLGVLLALLSLTTCRAMVVFDS